VAINEYRAVASFTEVLRAPVDVKVPLDLLFSSSRSPSAATQAPLL
jgi:hypothetical protein